MNSFGKVKVEVTVILGTADMPVRHLLKMGRGAEIALREKHTDPVWIYANNEAIARGEIQLDDDRIQITVTERI